jgi:hypothetical protein
MDIIREFKKPVSRQIVLDIPEKFVETDLEILIIPLNDKTRKKSVDKHSLFNKLCGLWENRGDITLESIRDKAWKRGGERGQTKGH